MSSSLFGNCLLLLTIVVVRVSSDKGTLYSMKDDPSGSSWLSVSTRGKTRHGWQYSPELSQYQVCDHGVQGADNRLVSPFIETKGAKVVEIAVEFKIKSCDLIGDASSSCNSERLQMGYVAADSASERPTDTDFASKPIDSDGLTLEAGVGVGPSTNQETTLLVVLGSEFSKRGLFLVLGDEGSCSSVSNVAVKYYFCPPSSLFLADYEQIVAPSAMYQVVTGQCAPNAQSASPPKAKCWSKGSWEPYRATCKCSPGFELVDNDCKPCGQNFYKSVVGNDTCQKCPYASSTAAPSDNYFVRSSPLGATKCECQRGKYRVNDSNVDSPCFGLPSNPRNVQVELVGLKALISWKYPASDGGVGSYPLNVWYSVVCSSCGDNDQQLSFTPHQSNIQGHSVTIVGLKPDTSYDFKIFSENDVSSKIAQERRSFSDVRFRTDAARFVHGLKVERGGWSGPSLTLSWQPPNGVVSPKYCVRVFAETNNIRFHNVNSTRFVPTGLQPGSYAFDVSVYGCEGPFSEKVTAQVTAERIMTEQRAQRITLTIVFLVFVFVLLITILTVATCFYRQRKGYRYRYRYQWANASNLVEYPCNSPPPLASDHNADFVKLPVGQGFLEPRQFEPIDRMLSEFVREISVSNLKWDESDLVPDSGFTSKAVGVLSGVDVVECVGSEDKRNVSLKFLHDCSSLNWRQFVIEAATMSQLSHPNVLLLHGVVFNDMTPIMVTELADMGSLDSLLLKNPSKFSTMQIVHMLRGVASGMQFLSEGGYVHKVIRGANILVTKSQLCKVAGFDVRVQMEEQLLMSSGADSDILEAMAPWCAIEVLSCRNFSSASDVWAFASLMWECISGGQHPLMGMTSLEIYKMLEQGNRLAVPNDLCPPVLYEMMNMCWAKDPKQRPWFCSIRQHLEELMTAPRHISPVLLPQQPHPNPSQNSNYYSFGRANELLSSTYCNRYQSTPSMTIFDLLSDLKLADKYMALFESNNFRYVDELSKDISKEFLKVLGISSKKDRLKIVDEVEKYKRTSCSYNSVSIPNSPLHYNSAASANVNSAPQVNLNLYSF